MNDRSLAGCLAAALALALAASHGADRPPDAPAAATGKTTTATRPVKPSCRIHVDERVELMSILFRLAGNGEYRRGRVPAYTRAVEKHFGAFKDHAAVRLARKLRRTRGVSFDAPMSMAIHVADAFDLKEKTPFTPRPVGLDRRWRPDEARAFLAAARRFAREAKFKAFCKAHQGLYDRAVAAMTETMKRHGHLEWFDRFFGRPPGAEFHLVLGMLNGPCCYGGRFAAGKTRELYCILGVWACDAKGDPKFPRSVLPTVVHEFAHSYCNPLVDKHVKALGPAGKAIWPTVAAKMKRQAYGNWRTMMYESLVRASVVRYRLRYDGSLAAMGEVMAQHRLGFAWTGELNKLLAAYEADRKKYPTLDDFMPRVVKFFDRYAANLAKKDNGK